MQYQEAVRKSKLKKITTYDKKMEKVETKTYNDDGTSKTIQNTQTNTICDLIPCTDDTEVVPFWDISQLGGFGIRVSGSVTKIIGVGGGIDIIYLGSSNEFAVLNTATALALLGAGIDGAGGIILIYDTPNANALLRGSTGLQANITVEGDGLQVSYTASNNKNTDGSVPQIYEVSYSTGLEVAFGSIFNYTTPTYIHQFGKYENNC
jgi:hypothetical protein